MKKRTISVILSIAMLLSLVGNVAIAHATDVIDNYYSNAFELSSKNESPKMDGKVFAGWYQEATFENPVYTNDDFLNGGAYAKFVDANVLSVKCQISAGTTTTSDTTDLRLLTSVDSFHYQSVGFYVEVNGKTQMFISDKVYSTVNGYTFDGKVKVYEPDEFSSESEYIMAFKLTQIPNSAFGTEIKIIPMWTTLDGTTVTGKVRTLKVYEGMDTSFVEEISYGEVWSAPSTVKIMADETDYTNGATKLSYQAVRNEYESSQLIVTAVTDITSYELYPTDLECSGETLLADNIEVYVQKYINYDDSYGTGSMPDALIPMEAADEYGENVIVANANGGLWVTIYIPKNTKAGVYEGDFILIVDGINGKELMKVPVSVEVMDYTLSDEVTAKTLFSWRYERVAAGELDGSLEMMETYYEFFQDYRISLQSLPLGTLSGEEYVENVLKYYDELTTYSLLSSIGDISTDLLSKQDKVKEQILSVAAHSTSEKNLFEKAMIYFIDEPDITDENKRNTMISNIEKLNALLQNCVDVIRADESGLYTNFKQIKNWDQTILNIPNIIPLTQAQWLIENESTEAGQALLEVMNCICPTFNTFTDEQADDLISICNENDIKIWWYGCTVPTSPSPTYHISDSNLLSSRSVSWLQSKYSIEGNLYWDAAAYTDEAAETYNEYVNVYEAPYRKTTSTWPAGDGFLAYPGAAYGVYGPIPSMRLMSIRDGMEEYEILKNIELNYTENASSFGEGFDANIAAENVLETFYHNLGEDGSIVYADGDNGLDFVELRAQLLKMAVGMNEGLGYAMGEVSYSGNAVTGYYATFDCFIQEGATVSFENVSSSSNTGQKYTVKSNKMSGDTYVTIMVSNGNESVTYTQYVGTKSSLLNTLSETTAVESNTDGAVVSETESASNNNESQSNEVVYNTEEGSELLFSFDSYAEITGTAIRVGKLLGETKVNKDSSYITEGEGSWMIKPEGDYGNKNEYPWFRMRCIDTTFKSSDFYKYDKVLMDVYNASDEEVTIQWSFTVCDMEGNYTDAEQAIFVLKPNACTTCEYDLTDEAYSGYFDLTKVKYMTVTFLDKKESKGDTVSELYFDNLRGMVSEEERQSIEWKYSFETGITFEKLSDKYLFENSQAVKTKMELSRIAYANTSLEKSASLMGLGSYGLRGNATDSVWPDFTVQFDKTYAKDSVLTFWMYVEADEEVTSGKTYRMEAYTEKGGTANTVSNGECQFNSWVEVKIHLNEASDNMWFFVNLDNGSSSSVLGDEPVHIYMDDFQFIDDSWGAIH